MALERVPIEGLAGYAATDIIPYPKALEASDCYLDDGTVRGRQGYIATCTTAAAPGTGTVQGIWRFRPSASIEADIVASDGYVYAFGDPSDDGESDAGYEQIGTGTVSGRVFGKTDTISAVQLGRYLYMASDVGKWVRVIYSVGTWGHWVYEELTTLDQPPAPGVNLVSQALRGYNETAYERFANGHWTSTLTNCSLSAFDSTSWYQVRDTAGTGYAPTDCEVEFEADVAQDWSGYDWLCVFVAAPASGMNHEVKIEVQSSLSGAPWFDLGSIADTETSTDRAPIFIFLPLTSIQNNAVGGYHRKHMLKMRFTLKATGSGTSADWAVLGFALCSTSTDASRTYYVSVKEWQTGVESPLSKKHTVALSPVVTSWPMIDGCYCAGGGMAHDGTYTLKPFAPSEWSVSYNGNLATGLPLPEENSLVGLVTLTGQYDKDGDDISDYADTLRLWRQTSSGIRLVKDDPIAAGDTTYLITDNVGDAAAANEEYQSGGDLPDVNALSAYGSQLVAGDVSPSGRRVHISSAIAFTDPTAATETGTGGEIDISADPYHLTCDSPCDLEVGDLISIPGAGNAGGTAALVTRITEEVSDGDFFLFAPALHDVSATTVTKLDVQDPYPTWPEDSSSEGAGSAFDLAPSEQEQVLALSAGDGVYLLSDQAVRKLGSLNPGVVPDHVYNRGAIGRRAAVYAEDALFWCAYDGIYSATPGQYYARSEPGEVSASIRQIVLDWFSPTSAVCMGYEKRHLWAFCGTRYLRYDFATQTWTRGTLAHSIVAAAQIGVGAEAGMRVLTSTGYVCRFTDDATGDLEIDGTSSGTAIPDWIYSTGMASPGVQTRPRFLYLNCDGSAIVTLHKSANGKAEKMQRFGPGETERPVGADARALRWRVQVTAANATTLTELAWERDLLDGVRGA